MRVRSRIVTLVTCAALGGASLGASTALAAPPRAPSSEAAQRKKEGDEAFLALRYADALRAYEASYKLSPNPALHFNRGRSLEALERYAEALDAFDAFLREAPPDIRAKAGNLAEHMTELRKKISTVSFTVKPAGARILVRDVAVGTAPLAKPLRVNAGTARIELDADGYTPLTRTVDLPGGGELALTFELSPKAKAAAVSERSTNETAPAPTSEAPAKSKSVLTRWWFWTGAAVVVGGAVAVTYVLTRPNEPKQGDLGQLAAPLLRF